MKGKGESSGARGDGGRGLSYKDAGVNIDAGNDLVERIKPACSSTRRPGCDSRLGGFGGFFDLSEAGYGGGDTVLVGATDGVGTKLKVRGRLRWVELSVALLLSHDLLEFSKNNRSSESFLNCILVAQPLRALLAMFVSIDCLPCGLRVPGGPIGGLNCNRGGCGGASYKHSR